MTSRKKRACKTRCKEILARNVFSSQKIKAYDELYFGMMPVEMQSYQIEETVG